MFEQLQPPEEEEPFTVPLITIAFGAGGLLLSLGLCGLGGGLGRNFATLSALGVIVFFLSMILLVVGVLMLIVAAFTR